MAMVKEILSDLMAACITSAICFILAYGVFKLFLLTAAA